MVLLKEQILNSKMVKVNTKMQSLPMSDVNIAPVQEEIICCTGVIGISPPFPSVAIVLICNPLKIYIK